MQRQFEAWNGPRFVVFGVAAWVLVVSLVAWLGGALAGPSTRATWLQTGLALPSPVTIIAIPIVGHRR